MPELKQTTNIAVQPNLQLNLTSENFSVRISGWEEEKVEISTDIEYQKLNDTELLPDEIIKIDHKEAENSLQIDLIAPPDLRIFRARFEMKIPHLSQIAANLENGSLKVNNLHGKQKLQTENGSIKLERMNGELNCLTENGSVLLDTCNAAIRVETENGAVKAAECEGNLILKTENGALKLKRCAGSLEAETDNGMIRIIEAGFGKSMITSGNGSIFYEFLPLEKGQFAFKNANGRIQLAIPDNLDYEIKARNKLGSFRISLPGEYERKQTGDRHILELLKGSGNVKIDVQNEFGSINLLNQTGKSFDFDADKIGEIFDGVLESIPDDLEIDTEKIREKLEKAKEKMKNIKLPDPHKIQMQIEKAMDDVGREIRKVKFDLNLDDMKEKAGEAISDVLNAVKDKFSSEEMTENERQESNRRSRLKILQLLQDGKITAEEAEKLLNAMEEI